MKKFIFALALASLAVSPAFAENEQEYASSSLKEISEKQDLILKALEDIKAELQIVKVRASNN